jgi:exosome complex component RRP42
MTIRKAMVGYVESMVKKGLREDGRDFLSYRNIRINTGKIPNAEGSAEVDLGYTKVLAGVKVGIGEPMKDKPDEGNLLTSAELLPLASEEYDIGPPSPEAIELARVVDRGIRAAGVIDTKSLFIEEGKVWEIFIDIYVLNYDGNLFDAGTIAASAALASARMPKYEDEKVIREGNLGRLKTGNVVTSCTFAKLGSAVLLDPDGNEETAMDGRLTMANDENAVRAMQKGLSGSFSFGEIDKAIEMSFERSKDLRKIIKNSTGE